VISLTSPSPAALRDVLDAPGGFLWWYADLTTSSGDGVVLIWSLGLPFLPDQANAGPPTDRPALSLAAYRNGRSDFYLLQDYGDAGCPVSIGRDPLGSGRLNQTTFRTQVGEQGLELHVEIDEQVPSSPVRLTGSFVLQGKPYTAPTGTPGAVHHWAPLVLHGTAKASLALGSERIELSGTGYFDSNFSRLPLADQGIARWLWGRVAFDDRTFAYYRTEMDDGSAATRVVLQEAGGQVSLLPTTLRLGKSRRGLFGLDSPRQVTLEAADRELTLDLGSPVEDGPFYQRFLVSGRDESKNVGRGIAEVLVPSRLDVPWQRPLVRMRTHVVAGRNSFWLPLFSGFRRRRLRRLLGGEVA
jgi:carotenoid 1,2-hydratase